MGETLKADCLAELLVYLGVITIHSGKWLFLLQCHIIYMPKDSDKPMMNFWDFEKKKKKNGGIKKIKITARLTALRWMSDRRFRSSTAKKLRMTENNSDLLLAISLLKSLAIRLLVQQHSFVRCYKAIEVTEEQLLLAIFPPTQNASKKKKMFKKCNVRDSREYHYEFLTQKVLKK